MTIYKGLRYYKYVYEDWTQPVLTANGTMGGESFAVSATNYRSGQEPYKAWDNNTSTYWGNYDLGLQDITFYNPTHLKVEKISISNVNSYTYSSGILYGSNDNLTWEEVGEFTNTVFTSGETYDLVFNSTKAYKYHRIHAVSANGGYLDIGEITITAQEAIPYLINLDGEDVYEAWEQPVLTANDSNSSFVVSASSEHAASLAAWKSFDGVIDSNCWISAVVAVSEEAPQYYYITTDTPLKISSISVTNRTGNYPHPVTKGILQASVNGNEWVDIVSIDNDIVSAGSTWTIVANETTGYKYHRIKITEYYLGSDNQQYVALGELQITAQQLVAIGGTKDDYDYAVPIKIKDSGRGVFIGSKNTNCLTYTPKHVDVELNPLNVNVTGTWGVIADGVAKGFSASNYLTYPEAVDVSGSWEVVLKLRTEATPPNVVIFSFTSNTNTSSQLSAIDGKFLFAWNHIPGNRWDTYDTGVTIPLKQDVWVKYTKTDTTFKLHISDNGLDYTEVATREYTASLYTPNTGVAFGGAVNQGAWTGVIDISQSYININGERWWSGDEYTTVGSWIDNGVVGSFTSANYVTVPEVLPSEITSSEYVFKITTGSSVTSPTNQVISGHKSPNTGHIVIRDSKFQLFTGSWNAAGVTTVLPNTDYFVKSVFDGSSWTLYSSTDGIDWIQEVTWSTTTNYVDTNVYIGRDYDTTGEYFKGTIDLSQSYIKINDEIWWQGGTGDVTLKAGSKVFIPNGYSDYDYYKYVYQDWTQPVLTENGVLGGDSFAVSASNYYDSPRQPFNAFDGKNAETSGCWHSTKGTTQWIAWYNPKPLKYSKITILNRPATPHAVKDYQIQVSDDGSIWDAVYSGTNTVSAATTSWDIDLSSINPVSKYMRLYADTSHGEYIVIGEITITAQEAVEEIKSTPNDYDYKVGVTKAFDEVTIPSDISAQSFANSELVVCYNPETNRLCFVGNDVYDTDNNVMSDNNSLPVARCTADNTSITYINQVFDWCGRIGNTAFVLPDVKGFIAKGYKDIGTYDSTEFTVGKVLTADIETVTDRSLLLSADKLDYVECNYNKVDNLLYNTDGEVINAVECGKVTSDGTAITSLTPYVAQPLTTAISINAICSGADLVYKVGHIFESSTAGTYTFKAPFNCVANVVIVGGGGGGAYMSSGYGSQSRAGGSGGKVTGSVALKAGEEYEIVVGSGGYGSNAANESYAGSGGASKAFGNTAGGGGGASCNVWSGSYVSGGGGGTATVDGFTASNGASGSTASRYGSYGGGGSAGAGRGQNGYVLITTKEI